MTGRDIRHAYWRWIRSRRRMMGFSAWFYQGVKHG